MVKFSCLTRTVSMHFKELFDCSKDHFNRQSLKAVVYIGLTLSANKSIFRRLLKRKKMFIKTIKAIFSPLLPGLLCPKAPG